MRAMKDRSYELILLRLICGRVEKGEEDAMGNETQFTTHQIIQFTILVVMEMEFLHRYLSEGDLKRRSSQINQINILRLRRTSFVLEEIIQIQGEFK